MPCLTEWCLLSRSSNPGFFFKHYSESGEKILALTCTEQLQKWHRRSRKGSIPIVPLRQFKLTATRINKKAKGNIDIDTTLKEVKADIEEMKRLFSEHILFFIRPCHATNIIQTQCYSACLLNGKGLLWGRNPP